MNRAKIILLILLLILVSLIYIFNKKIMSDIGQTSQAVAPKVFLPPFSEVEQKKSAVSKLSQPQPNTEGEASSSTVQASKPSNQETIYVLPLDDTILVQ